MEVRALPSSERMNKSLLGERKKGGSLNDRGIPTGKRCKGLS